MSALLHLCFTVVLFLLHEKLIIILYDWVYFPLFGCSIGMETKLCAQWYVVLSLDCPAGCV